MTLLEILIAGVCLAGSSVGVLAALRFANDRAIIARYRTMALQLVRSEIEAARGDAVSYQTAAGTTTQNLTSTGIPYTVTLTRTTTLIAGTNRYNVSATATWTMSTSYGSSPQTIQLDTIVVRGGIN